MTLISRVIENPPHWANDVIQSFDERLLTQYSAFVYEEEWSANSCINVFNVVGTRNANYHGWSWLRLLIQDGKRVSRRQDYEDNPSYFDGEHKKEPAMSYISSDGSNYYVDSDGNHRTCITRFAFAAQNRTTLHGVEVKQIRLNQEFLTVFNSLLNQITLKKLRFNIIGSRNMVKRLDVAGWKKDLFETYLTVNGVWHLSFLDAKEWLIDLQKPRLFPALANFVPKKSRSNHVLT